MEHLPRLLGPLATRCSTQTLPYSTPLFRECPDEASAPPHHPPSRFNPPPLVLVRGLGGRHTWLLNTFENLQLDGIIYLRTKPDTCMQVSGASCGGGFLRARACVYVTDIPRRVLPSRARAFVHVTDI